MPVCFVANLGRGYLAPLAFVMLTVVLAQVIAILGYGGYFPWSVPALHSGVTEGSAEQLNTASYLVVAIVSLAGVATTFSWWNRADQTR